MAFIRKWIAVFIVLVVSPLPLIQEAEGKDQPPLPSILYIMSDDHCERAIGVCGSRLAELNPTPNLDRLARNGMVFDNVFCTNSICTPSRASILTG